MNMFISVNHLANKLLIDEPDNLGANALQEGLGGQFEEKRTMMHYLFQNFNFRGKAKPYQDVIESVAPEEMGHVELISTIIGMLLEDSDNEEPPNKLPLNIVLEAGNIHHTLVASLGAMPLDSAGTPLSGSYVYNSGNLVLENLPNQQWTLSNEAIGLSEIFNGSSPFGDGDLEAFDVLPEGFDIPQMPEVPQEYAHGLDTVLSTNPYQKNEN
jgi:Mn-containing catalase